MKLDKIRFARLIGYVAAITGKDFTPEDVDYIDRIIDVEVPQPDVAYPSTIDVNDLMRMMAGGTQKIEVVKLHRKLTGWGLKESKDQVEKYWPALSNHYVPPAAPAFPPVAQGGINYSAMVECN